MPQLCATYFRYFGLEPEQFQTGLPEIKSKIVVDSANDYFRQIREHIHLALLPELASIACAYCGLPVCEN